MIAGDTNADPTDYITRNRIYSILVDTTPYQVPKIPRWFFRTIVSWLSGIRRTILCIAGMGKLVKYIYDLSDRLSIWWRSLTGVDVKQKALEMKQDYATPKRINIAIDEALGIDNDKTKKE